MSTPLHETHTPPSHERRYGFIGLIATDRERHGVRINQVLAAHAECIVGRLGMPNLENGAIAIITLIVHATTDEIGSLNGKLGSIPGVSVKSALHKARLREIGP